MWPLASSSWASHPAARACSWARPRGARQTAWLRGLNAEPPRPSGPRLSGLNSVSDAAVAARHAKVARRSIVYCTTLSGGDRTCTTSTCTCNATCLEGGVWSYTGFIARKVQTRKTVHEEIAARPARPLRPRSPHFYRIISTTCLSNKAPDQRRPVSIAQGARVTPPRRRRHILHQPSTSGTPVHFEFTLAQAEARRTVLYCTKDARRTHLLWVLPVLLLGGPSPHPSVDRHVHRQQRLVRENPRARYSRAPDRC